MTWPAARDWRESAHDAIAPVLLVLLPILVKLPSIVGMLRADPMLLFSGIQLDVWPLSSGGYSPFPTIDPNVGFTSQALGHRALGGRVSARAHWVTAQARWAQGRRVQARRAHQGGMLAASTTASSPMTRSPKRPPQSLMWRARCEMTSDSCRCCCRLAMACSPR